MKAGGIALLIRHLVAIASAPALLLGALSANAASVGSSLADALRAADADDKIEIIIELHAQADAAAAAASVPSGDRNAHSAAVIGALQSTASSAQAGLRTYLAGQEASGTVADVTPFWIFNGISVRSTKAVVSAIASRPEIASVTLDETITLPPVTPGTGGAAIAAPEWGINKVGAPIVWNFLGTKGEGSVVGILDTGLDPDHPDLLPCPVAWFDAVNGNPDPYDDNNHGSHVTGTSVGGNAGGSDIGVAPGARYISCKAFDQNGSGSSTNILRCMQWFTDPDGNPGTADYPDVVNNSWSSGPNCSTTFTNSVRAWWALGIFPDFAAGGFGPGVGSAASPGQNPESFGVGATDINDVIASFSGRGPSSCDGSIFPEVSAPGVNIRSSISPGWLRELQRYLHGDPARRWLRRPDPKCGRSRRQVRPAANAVGSVRSHAICERSRSGGPRQRLRRGSNQLRAVGLRSMSRIKALFRKPVEYAQVIRQSST